WPMIRPSGLGIMAWNAGWACCGRRWICRWCMSITQRQVQEQSPRNKPMRLRTRLFIASGGLILLLWAVSLLPLQRTIQASFDRVALEAFTGTRQGLGHLRDERAKQLRQAGELVMNIPELRALIAESPVELTEANKQSLQERLDKLSKLLDVRGICVLNSRGELGEQNLQSPWPDL